MRLKIKKSQSLPGDGFGETTLGRTMKNEPFMPGIRVPGITFAVLRRR